MPTVSRTQGTTTLGQPIPDPEEATVNTPIPAWWRMAQAWDLIDALMEGTRAMRARRTTYLPQYTGEDDGDYNDRLAATVLFPGFRDAVQRLAVKPFAKPVHVEGSDKLPQQLQGIEKDANGEGLDLTCLCKELLIDGVSRGAAIVYIDYPSAKSVAAESSSRAAAGIDNRLQEMREIRPYFRRLPPKDVIGWNGYRNAKGFLEVTELRWREKRIERVGDWGQREVNYVRVVTAPAIVEVERDGVIVSEPQRGEWTTYRQDPKTGEWSIAGNDVHDFPGIPVVWMEFERASNGAPNADEAGSRVHGETRPPLEDVAWINLSHWQSASRQGQYLEIARLGILWASGLTQEEGERGILIGPGRLNWTEKEGVKLEVVEHNAKAAEAGWNDLDRKEARMLELSFEPLKTKTGNPTATGKALEASKNTTDIEVWVRLLEAGIELAYALAGIWVSNPELSDEFGVDIWSEFAVALTKDADLQALLALRKEGDLSQETILSEHKRRGVLGDRIDVDEEIERTDRERAARAAEFAAQDAALNGQADTTPQNDPTGQGGQNDGSGNPRQGEAA